MLTKIITLLLLPCFFSSASLLQAQTIEAPRGYSPQIGNLVSMLDDLKERVTRSVRDLDQAGTDFLLNEDANRIGAMIYHLAATEKYYQLYTFEGRQFNNDEAEWDLALSLGAPAREALVDKPIQYYLDIWDDVRKETKRLLKTRDDKWLSEKVNRSNMNNHWAWYHVMEHQANHMGQIRMIIMLMP
ncbi:MAG: DinB family protein [Bacteroidota bacterium]